MEIDVDDVFIPGQHQASLRTTTANTDIFVLFPRYGQFFVGHERPRRKVKTRIGRAVIFTKEELNGLLFRFHRVEAGRGPKHDGDQATDDKGAFAECRPAAIAASSTSAVAATATAHQYAQLVLTLAHQFVDLGHLLWAIWWASVATAIVVVTAAVVSSTRSAAPGAARISSHLNVSFVNLPR